MNYARFSTAINLLSSACHSHHTITVYDPHSAVTRYCHSLFPPLHFFLLLHFTFSLCFLISRRLRCASSLKRPMRKRPWGSWVFAFVFHFLPKQFYLTPSSSSALFHSLSVNQRSMKDCLCASDINRHIWSEIKMYFLPLSLSPCFWQVTSKKTLAINVTNKLCENKIRLVTFYIIVL